MTWYSRWTCLSVWLFYKAYCENLLTFLRLMRVELGRFQIRSDDLHGVSIPEIVSVSKRYDCSIFGIMQIALHFIGGTYAYFRPWNTWNRSSNGVQLLLICVDDHRTRPSANATNRQIVSENFFVHPRILETVNSSAIMMVYTIHCQLNCTRADSAGNGVLWPRNGTHSIHLWATLWLNGIVN